MNLRFSVGLLPLLCALTVGCGGRDGSTVIESGPEVVPPSAADTANPDYAKEMAKLGK